MTTSARSVRSRPRGIPNRLWEYRKRMGFTQRDVARVLGYHSTGDISSYEHGVKLPSLITALKLEIVYRVPVSFLFPGLYGPMKMRLFAREEELRAERRAHEAKRAR